MNAMCLPVSPALHFRTLMLSRSMIADLRSDHAGEVGAVMIYRGVLAVSKNEQVRHFAQRHLAGEQKHLRFFEDFLPVEHQSKLLNVWRAAGWLTGALPALAGPSAVYLTIDAVETFVGTHYTEQIERMADDERLATLRAILTDFRADELLHRDDAAGHYARHTGPVGRSWHALVGLGSAAGVALTRRI